MSAINIINWTESTGRNPVVLFNNLLTESTPDDPSAVDAISENTYEVWGFTGPQTVSFQLETLSEFNSFALIGVKGLEEVVLYWSVDGVGYTEINSGPLEVEDSDCTLFLFDTIEANFFRLEILGTSQAHIRSMWLSKVFEFPGGVGYGYTPPWLAQEKELLVSKTMNGQFVGNRVLSKGAMTEIPMVPEERSFVEEDLQPFMEHYNDGQPFVWAAGPSVFTKDVAYVWRQQNSEMRPVFDQSGNWMSLNMMVEGYVT